MADGLLSESIQKRLLRECNVDIKKAYKKALSVEVASQKDNRMQAISQKTQLKQVYHESPQRRSLYYHVVGSVMHLINVAPRKLFVDPVIREVT